MPRKHHSSLKNIILSEWQSTGKLYVIAFTLLSLIAGVYFAVLSDGFASYADFCLPDGAPPTFFLPFLWIMGFLLLGASAGAVMSVREKCYFRHKKRGLFLCALTFFLLLLWAPVFFLFEFFFLGVLIICVALALSLFAVLELLAMRRLPAISMLFFWLWLLFLLYLNLAILFLN